MDESTKRLAETIKKKGISISAIEKNTEIPKGALYNSLGSTGNRALRADEFLEICSFAGIDPLDLYECNAT